MSRVIEGKAAPAFSGTTQNGESIALKDFKGKYVALYFYPKDDTPGCTAQACHFRDSYQALHEKDGVGLCVSIDSVESHLKLAHIFDLPFPLIADPEKKIVEKYDVWVEKSMYGRKYMGTERSCFLIDPKGKVKKIFRKVKPAENVKLVLKAIEEGC